MLSFDKKGSQKSFIDILNYLKSYAEADIFKDVSSPAWKALRCVSIKVVNEHNLAANSTYKSFFGLYMRTSSNKETQSALSR